MLTLKAFGSKPHARGFLAEDKLFKALFRAKGSVMPTGGGASRSLGINAGIIRFHERKGLTPAESWQSFLLGFTFTRNRILA